MPYDSDVIIIGCGNILFKDDGFGPILINILQKYFDDKNDYYDPAVTAYVEDEFDKEVLSEIQEKFEGIEIVRVKRILEAITRGVKKVEV